MKVIPYPISINYMKHWTVKEAVRELLQNAIDSGEYSLAGSNDTQLVISNEVPKDLTLDELTILGESSKQGDNESIGKFGEGLKLALLVLAREQIFHIITIVNHDNSEFQMSAGITDNKLLMGMSGELTEPRYINITVSSESAVKASKELLLSKQEFKTVVKTASITALTPGGKLFVNDLYVCDTKLQYSYNFSPELLTLDRDRRTVDNFNLVWEVSKLWACHDDLDMVVDMVYSKVPDCEFVSSSAPFKLIQAIYEHYLKHYGPGTVLAESAARAKVYSQHYQKVVYIGGGYSTMVTSHPSYAEDSKTRATRVNPATLVQEFVDSNARHMRAKAKKAAIELKLTSLHW